MEHMARIYIADQRNEKAYQSGWLRSTLNYADYYSPHRERIGALRYVNEWGGAGKQQFELSYTTMDSLTVLLPLANGIRVVSRDAQYAVDVGEILIIPSDLCKVSALHEDGGGFVFQELVLSVSHEFREIAQCIILPLGGTSPVNRMLPVLEQTYPFQCYVGAYFGKEEETFVPDEQFSNFFVYVLEGSFEVEKRLVFAGDSLSLSKYSPIEIECLSANGLLLGINF